LSSAGETGLEGAQEGEEVSMVYWRALGMIWEAAGGKRRRKERGKGGGREVDVQRDVRRS
jgi:hypothetical protein